jgi:hypothetical protein
MPTYKLRLHFNPNDLRLLISNGYNVAIVKDVGDLNFNPPVAWLAFRPREDTLVTWEEEYGIYSSLTTIEPGASIQILSTTGIPASQGKIYELNSSGKFGLPQDGEAEGVSVDVYQVYNQYDTPSHFLALGLYQSANVDGAPLDRNVASVAQVPYKAPVRLTVSPSVLLIVARQESGTVIPRLYSIHQTRVRFGSDTEASFTFNIEGYFERSGGRPKEDASSGTTAGGLAVEQIPPQPA